MSKRKKIKWSGKNQSGIASTKRMKKEDKKRTQSSSLSSGEIPLQKYYSGMPLQKKRERERERERESERKRERKKERDRRK